MHHQDSRFIPLEERSRWPRSRSTSSNATNTSPKTSFFSKMHQEHSKALKTPSFDHKAQTKVRVSMKAVGEVEVEKGMVWGS